MVEQFGLAMIPRCLATSCGLTSGTTRGTSGSIRKALELSTTTAPARAAIGLYWRETQAGGGGGAGLAPPEGPGGGGPPPVPPPPPPPRLPPPPPRGRDTFVSPPNSTDFPALRSEARNLIDPTGNFRSWSRRIITSPTAPLAPTTATLFTADPFPDTHETVRPRASYHTAGPKSFQHPLHSPVM